MLTHEDYLELRDIIERQQQFHYDLGGPYSDRFL